MPPKPVSKSLTYHHGNLRTALLDAGLVALKNAGHRNLSLRALARQVGVSANAVYHHFKNKEALLVAMAAEGFRKLALASIEVRLGKRSPVQAIRATGYMYIQFARANPSLFKLMFERVDPKYQTEEYLLAARSALETIYVDMAKALKLTLDDPRVTTGAIHAWSHVHGLSLLILDGQLDHNWINLDQLIDTVANGYQPPKLGRV